jgi:hypothetical protein
MFFFFSFGSWAAIIIRNRKVWSNKIFTLYKNLK